MHKILFITTILIGFEIQDNWAMVPSIPNPLIPNLLGPDLPALNPNPMKSSMWIQPPFCQQGPGSSFCMADMPMFTYNATEGKVKSSYTDRNNLDKSYQLVKHILDFPLWEKIIAYFK